MANTQRLTPRQFSVYKFIKHRMQTTGAPPTRREIAENFGFSSANAAECHLRALERKGLISITPRVSRGIKIIGDRR